MDGDGNRPTLEGEPSRKRRRHTTNRMDAVPGGSGIEAGDPSSLVPAVGQSERNTDRLAELPNLFQDENATREQRLSSLLFSDDLSDCKFVVGVEQKSIAAHKFLLAVMSSVFYCMFYGKLPETDVVKVTDITVEGFTGMLQYIYSKSVDFSSIQHAIDVLLAARKYIIPLLEEACVAYVKEKLTAENCLELLEIASDLQCASLKACCVDFIRSSTSKILDSESFLVARQSSVQTIVEQEMLSIGSELELFKDIERWILAESNRKGKALQEMAGSFSNLIKNIRFLSMSNTEFASAPAKSDLLNDREKVLIYGWIGLKEIVSLPSSISSLTEPRMTGKSGKFTGVFSVRPLAQLKTEQWLYSLQGCTVERVKWKAGILKGSLFTLFYICTEDENESLQEPKEAKLRVLDLTGEVEVTKYENDGVLTRGWVDQNGSFHSNGHLCLYTSYIKNEKLRTLQGTLRLEVRIEVA